MPLPGCVTVGNHLTILNLFFSYVKGYRRKVTFYFWALTAASRVALATC